MLEGIGCGAELGDLVGECKGEEVIPFVGDDVGTRVGESVGPDVCEGV